MVNLLSLSKTSYLMSFPFKFNSVTKMLQSWNSTITAQPEIWLVSNLCTSDSFWITGCKEKVFFFFFSTNEEVPEIVLSDF